jgi:hypothetical protein
MKNVIIAVDYTVCPICGWDQLEDEGEWCHFCGRVYPQHDQHVIAYHNFLFECLMKKAQEESDSFPYHY